MVLFRKQATNFCISIEAALLALRRIDDSLLRSKLWVSWKVCIALTVVSAMLPLLTGCAPHRLKADFSGFESAFAETSNREVLLNLARLQNRDPTYFFKLGQITSAYHMSASLTGAGNYTIPNVNIGGNAIGGGSPALSYQHDPTFNFIPVSDDTNAQLLLKPVPPETFYILYQQGWRLDQLMRLMIDRIEIPRHSRGMTKGPCLVQTVRNLPPTVHSEAEAPDPDSLGDYVTFLRVSALAYELQKHGYLKLRGTSTFAPFDKNSHLSSSAKDGPPGVGDLAKAASANQTWELTDKGWTLGMLVPGAQFMLNPPPSFTASSQPGAAAAEANLIGQLELELQNVDELKVFFTADHKPNGQTLARTLYALSGGFSIDAATTPPLQETTGTGGNDCGSPHLVMRSLLGLMSAAAQEQATFEKIDGNTIIKQSRWEEATGETAQTFFEAVPEIERLPVLQLTWETKDSGMAPITQLDYRGKHYFVADSEKQPAVNKYWNRDMFRLVAQLQSQVSVDISKFPLPAVLQLNTQ